VYRAFASEEGEPAYETSLSNELLSLELLHRNVELDLLTKLGNTEVGTAPHGLLHKIVGSISVNPPELGVSKLAIIRTTTDQS
jgi:hypothetical protein